MKKRIQPHIMCGVGDVARYVFLPGDPGRIGKIVSFFDEAKKISEYRGFITYTGEVNGIEISACSTGIGCPSAAIVMEELSRIGVDCFIRLGTTGSLQRYIDIGDIVVATSAVRSDGASKSLIPAEYPAVASIDVTSSLLRAAENLEIDVHSGIVISSDLFYGGNEDIIKRYSNANVLSIEMESSLLFTMAGMKGLRAGAILAVDGNLVTGSGKGEFEPGEKSGEFDERVNRAIENEIRIAIKAVEILEDS